MNEKQLKILNVERSEQDSHSVRRALEVAGLSVDWSHVSTLDAVRADFEQTDRDIIISEFSLNDFSVLDVLKIRDATGADTPIIVVTDVNDQESAVLSMRLGAGDYLSKTDLTRLVPAVEREVEQAANRRQRRKAENALAVSEERLKIAISVAGLATWEWDIETGDFSWSAEALAILSIPDCDERSRSLLSLVHPDDLDRAKRDLDAVIYRGSALSTRLRLRRSDDEFVWTEIHGRASLAKDRTASKLVGTIKDISLDKKGEEALIEAEKRYRVMAESASDAVISIDGAGSITYANPSCEQIFGYKPLELVGNPLTMLMPDTWAGRHTAAFGQYVQTGKRKLDWRLAEAKGLRKDGTEIDIQISFGHHTRHGRHSFTGFIRDVTESKRAENTLRRSEENFRALVQATTQYIWQLDEAGKIIEYPYWWEDLTGMAFSDSVDFGWLEAVHADDQENVRSRFITAISTGQAVVVELRIRARSGEFRSYEASAVPLKTGATCRWICALKDLTEQRTAEERFRLVSSIATDFMFETTKQPDGRYELTWVAGAFAKITGYSPDELRQLGGWHQIVHPEDREKDNADLAQLAENQDLDSEIRIVRPDGTTVWVRVLAQPVWDHQTNSLYGICGAVQDITERKVAEIAVREREERLRTILDAEPECVKIIGPDAEILEINPAGLALLEIESLADLGQESVEVYMRDDHAAAFRECIRLAMSGEPAECEYELKTASGNWKWLEMKAVPLRDSTTGETTSVLGVSRDVTAKRKAEVLLLSSQQKHLELINSVEGIVWEADVATFSFTFVSKQAETILGYPIEDWYDATFWAGHIYPGDRDWAVNFCVAATEKGEPHAFEYRMVAKDGRLVWLRDIVSVVLEDGKPTRLRGIMVDVTEKRESDAARQLQATLIEQANEAIFSWDPEGGILEWNKGCEKLYGYKKAEVLGKFGFDIIRSRTGVSRPAFMKLLRENREWSGTVVQRTKDGRSVYADSRYQMSTIDGREIVLQTNRDITESRLAQAALRESESRYRELFANSPHPMWIYDNDSLRFLAVNDCAVERYGYSVDDFLSMTVADIHPKEDLEKFLPHVRSELKPLHKHGDWKHKKKSGELITVEVTSHAVTWEGRTARLVLAHDITDRVQAERAVTRSEAKYRDLFENANDIIYTHTLDGRITSLNRAGRKVFGYTEEEALSMNISDFAEEEFLREAARSIRRGSADDATRTYHTRAFARDGRRVPLEIRARLIFSEEDHQPIGIQGIARDITERLESEEALRTSEDQLRQAQKLESIGILAGGLAHDFNNMLTAINGYSDLVLRKLQTDDPIRKNVEEIRKAGARSADLTSQLLAFSRRQILQPKILNLNRTIDETTSLLERLIGEDIVVIKTLEPNLPAIEADPTQLSQVLMNLAVNSRDAMPNGGTLMIETSMVPGDLGDAKGLTGGRTGLHILLEVSDTGVGMDEDTCDRVFEPFFTTKSVGRGTGLGLSTAYGIVKQSGGNIWVSSEIGKGTKFSIYFPVAEQPLRDHSRSITEHNMFVGSGKILLVEDEVTVRGLASKILESCGYTVFEANDGEDALVKYESLGEVDMLITDVVMPKMGGRELSEILTARKPELKVLYTSGYTDDATILLGVGKHGTSFLQKPFTFETLAGKVRSLIDS